MLNFRHFQSFFFKFSLQFTLLPILNINTTSMTMPGEKVYGAVGEPQNTTVLMETIYKLKQEIQKSHAEKQAMAEQLNCLILLVKR